MRAAVITTPGGPEVLRVLERPIPPLGNDQILVRVHASALNRADLMQREGRYPAPPGAPVDIPGLEFAGEVAAVGEPISRWRVGERVFGITGGGGHAEFVVTHEEAVAAVPRSLSWIEAAAVPEAFITAHDALVTQARVQPGERVLIHAVGSGVGLAATQLVRAFGAIPYGTARTADKVARARDYGLEDGIVIGQDLEAIPARVAAWTDGRGMDVTLDLVGGGYLDPTVRATALKGRIMLVGTVAGRTGVLPLGVMLNKRITIRGTVLRARSLDEKVAATRAFAKEVVPLLERGDVRPVIDSVFDIGDIGNAHERMASNESFGKIVIRME
jgi:putative PIG3 family NAD(P)H quinone oxidoreductase